MVAASPFRQPTLYDTDETGWLERTAQLISEGRLAEVDTASLHEYLTDMARRDRREIERRLFLFLAHVLKWEYQPEKRSASWRRTIRSQRKEIVSLVKSETLRHYAEQILPSCYVEAKEFAAEETGLDDSTFPRESNLTLDAWLAFEPVGETP